MSYFDEYINSGDPDKKEKAAFWGAAIGLQAVDELKTSDYLIELAKLNIEGIIDFDEVERRLDNYHRTRSSTAASDTVSPQPNAGSRR